MPLVRSNVPLKIGGLQTKTDSRYVLPGDLTSLQNVRFDEWPKLRKRNGYARLSNALTVGGQIVAYKQQLLASDGKEAYGYSAGSGLTDKGVLEAATVSARAVRRDIYAQSSPDIAVHPQGLTVAAWETSAGGAQYNVVDTATGQEVVPATSLGANATKPKCLSLGQNVVILFFDTALVRIRYVVVPAIAPASPAAVADFATDPAVGAIYDATVIGASLFVVYANNGGSNKITLRAMTAQLVLGAATVPTTTEAFNTCCGVFGDPNQNVWVAYYTGTAVKVFAYDFGLANLVMTFTQVDGAPGTVRNITGIVPTQPTGTLLYEATGSASYNNLVSSAVVQFGGTAPPVLAAPVGSTTGGTLAAGTYYYVVSALGASGETIASNEVSVTTTGATSSVALSWTAVTYATGYRVYRGTSAGGESVYYAPGNVTSYTDTNAASSAGSPLTNSTFVGVSTPSGLLRSVGLASKPFYYLSRVHFLAAYQSTLQSTYFLVSGSTVVGKLAPALGGGLTAKSILPEIPTARAGSYTVPYLQTDQLTSQGGNIFTQAGVMAATFDFTQPQTAVELSDDLHITGGILSMYDGSRVVEHGFHVYPENLQFSVGGAGSISGSYQAFAVYEWMDAQGLIHQSGPSPVVTITASSAAYFNYTVQSLRLTSKAAVNVVFYRTLANGSVFYRVTPVGTPNLNTKTADTVSAPANADTASDATLVGNAQCYANPTNVAAELPNLAAPAPLHVWRYRNRVALIPAENPFQWMYSKPFTPGVPIEFNEGFLYQPVAQDGGPLTCGIEMDEKNVLFTSSRIYVVVGDGPSVNATGSDYGASPFAVPTDVGCSNRRSLVLTPMGVMFQAANGKGIYLLGRDLSVQYIGAPVESYNSLTITAARLVPNSRRVIFFTNGGIALVYDTFAQKWAVFTNHAAVDACVFGGLVTYMQSGGAIMQETPEAYTDAGAPVLISFATSILSFAGLSGFQRVYRFALRGDYRSPHTLRVAVAYDDNPAPSQTETVQAATVLSPGSAADTLAGDTEIAGGGYPAYEWLVKCAQQKCSSVQIFVQETQTGPTYGEGFSLSAVTFLVGALRGLHPVGSGRSI